MILNLIMGLLSAFSPCLFPLLPSYVALTLRESQPRSKVFFSSLFLIAGLMTVFLLIGSISDLIGSFLINNYSTFARIQGALLIIAGLLMIKTPDFIYSITMPQKLQDWIYNEERGKNRPFVFNYILGLLFTIIAAPCAAGFFVASWGTLVGQTFLSQVAYVAAFGIGVGLPFMTMSLFLPDMRGEVIGKMHSATSKISLVLGIILVIVGVVLIWELLPTSTLVL